MSRWWRAYDEAVDDPKLILLTDKQHRAWFNLCCITSQNGGTLPALQVVAVKLRMSTDKAKDMIAQLTALGLIDHAEPGIFAPHNWNGRQYKSDVTDPTNAQRQKRYRNARKTVTPTVTVKRPDTETEAETDLEREETRASALAVPDDWPTDFRERFWAKYPNKVGRADAIAKLERARKSGKTTWSTLIGGLDRYIAKTDDRPWCNPATWLHQQRWTDQPATQAQGNGQRPHHAPNAGRSGANDFFAGLASLAEDIGGDGAVARPADEDIPRGRVEIDG